MAKSILAAPLATIFEHLKGEIFISHEAVFDMKAAGGETLNVKQLAKDHGATVEDAVRNGEAGLVIKKG
ncbi:hypothetical protein [Paracoccus pacificus]|uniref:Uncharacterized protein n=1 Tax=Paracoccus pacificus TaxID=1463598 RepID=A0ABW4R903_9RHOB